MSAPTISLEQALEYAKNAKDHARDQIRRGGTQLDNNSLAYSYHCN